MSEAPPPPDAKEKHMSEAPLPLETKDKLDILRLLVTENNKELVFWRERNWVALRDTVAGLVALAGISMIRPDANYALVAVAITIAVFASLYLHKNFERYEQKLADGARFEEALSIYAKGVYLPTNSLLPESYRKPKANKRGSYVFITTVWVITTAVSWGLIVPKKVMPNPSFEPTAPEKPVSAPQLKRYAFAKIVIDA